MIPINKNQLVLKSTLMTKIWDQILGDHLSSCFVQSLTNICLDAEMVYLYENFVLLSSSILSMYWRMAYVMLNSKRKWTEPGKMGPLLLT